MLCYLGLYRDPRNLKSPAHCERAGSSPAPGTTFLINKVDARQTARCQDFIDNPVHAVA